MAIYHLQLRAIQRSRGRSAIQVVAYIRGQRLKSPRLGRVFGRGTSKDRVVRVGRIGTQLSAQHVWAAAEDAERRKDSIEGRHVVVALPRELSEEKQWRLLLSLGDHIHQTLGVVVEVAFHAGQSREGDEPHNPHGHLVFSSRQWCAETQSFGRKTRQLDVATTGSKIVEGLRAHWESSVNATLPARIPPVSRLSHARAGRNCTPMRHLGAIAWAQEQAGYLTRYGALNRLIRRANLTREELTVAELEIAREIGRAIDRPAPAALEEQLQIARKQISEMRQLPQLPAKQPANQVTPRINNAEQAPQSVPCIEDFKIMSLEEDLKRASDSLSATDRAERSFI